jgi:hypothetical protein
MSTAYDARRNVRQRIANQVLIPAPVNAPRGADDSEPSIDELKERVGELEGQLAAANKTVERLRKGCAAGYAREAFLEQILTRHGIVVPSRR